MCPFEDLRKQENERQSKIIKESYLEKISYINENNIIEVLNERKSDLDRYVINLAEDLICDLRLSIVEYLNNGNIDTKYLIKMKNGMLYFKLKNEELKLYIYLNKRNSNNPASYNNKLNALLLNILNENNNVDQTTISLLKSTDMLGTIAHELSHYINDSRKKSSGKQLGLIKYQKDKLDDKTYTNNDQEVDSLIKEVEVDCMEQLNKALVPFLSYLDIDTQKDYFADAFKNIMKDYKNNKTSRFYEKFNNLERKNLNKVYKDVYDYCLDEFLKNKMIYTNNNNNIIKLRKRIFDSDAFNKWLSDNKF